MNWNGYYRTTTFVSSTQLRASINAFDIAATGAAQVTVFTPSPGGGASASQSFLISRPQPVISALSPPSATAGGPGFTLGVSGSGFLSTSVVQWNGEERTTTYVNSATLRAAIPAQDIASPGTAAITVFTPGGGTSAVQVFPIASPPVITSLSPSSAAAGSGAFTLAVDGTGFVASSLVRWTWSERATTFVSSTRLTAQILAADIAAAGSAMVMVENPVPGGGTLSNPSRFTITQAANPVATLLSLAPSSAAAGGAAFTLTVAGSNFVPGSVVRWNGSDRPTTFVSSTQLTAQISAADIGAPGSASVAVFNPAPGGGLSGALPFSIVAGANPVPTVASLAPASTVAGGPAFTLSVAGSNFVAGSVVRWNGADRPTTFVSGTQLIAAIAAADIATVGTAQVLVFNPPPGGGASNAVSFTVLSAGPAVSGNGLANAAGYSTRAQAPGSIVALFGVRLASVTLAADRIPLPAILGGVTVQLDGFVAPLLFVSPTQINFQIPWEMLSRSQVSVTVTSGGVTSEPVVINVAAFAPGLFSLDSSGAGQGAVLIEATGELAAPFGSVAGRNARPARRGEIISVFATGLGPVTNQPSSGFSNLLGVLSQTVVTPAVTIGGVRADVMFSGLAPIFVGLNQVNALVPDGAPVGPAVPLAIGFGGISSNVVTIAVQ